MDQFHTITAQVDDSTFEMVERLAKSRGVSGAEFAAEAIRRVAESDDDHLAFIQAGIDAIDRGEVISQDEVLAELDRMIALHRARCT